MNLKVIGCCLGLAGFSAYANQEPAEPFETNIKPLVRYQGEETPAFTILERMEEYKIPGVSIAVIENGEVVLAKGYGVKSQSTQDPVDENTLFQVASISKPVTAVMALQQVERGRLSLYEPVSKHIDDWGEGTLNNEVTIAGLISHTAGYDNPMYLGYEPEGTEKGFVDWVKSWFEPDMPDLLGSLKGEGISHAVVLDEAAIGQWKYAGGGYSILQYLLEQTTGKSFDELAKTEVLEPLNMTNSTFDQAGVAGKYQNLAHAHIDGEEIQGLWRVHPEKAAAGLWTTPTDLGKFVISLQAALDGGDGKVVSNETARLLLQRVNGFAGHGVFVQNQGTERYFHHGGVNYGMESHFVAYEQGGKAAIVLTNGNRGDGLALEILHSIAETYDWQNYKYGLHQAERVAADTLRTYVGTYEFESGFEMEVTEADGVLFVQGEGQDKFAVYPSDEVTFFPTQFYSRFVFKKDSEGNVSGVEQLWTGGSWIKASKL